MNKKTQQHILALVGVIAMIVAVLVIAAILSKKPEKRTSGEVLAAPISAFSEPGESAKVRKAKFALTAEQAARFQRIGLSTDPEDWALISVEDK